MNWAFVMIEPSVRTLLIRLYYPDLSSRMRPGHHRSYVINDPPSFDFQLVLLLVRGLALLSCFGAYFNFRAKNENLILSISCFHFFLFSLVHGAEEKNFFLIILSFKMRTRTTRLNLVPWFFPRLKSRHQVNLFCLNVFLYT